MTDEAARAYDRGRRSSASPEEAWDRLKELAETADWNTAWLENRSDTTESRRRR